MTGGRGGGGMWDDELLLLLLGAAVWFPLSPGILIDVRNSLKTKNCSVSHSNSNRRLKRSL
ncbi:hypothetical protein BDZ91DRAFT_751668, partial [Kalaharituber pfeilii]